MAVKRSELEATLNERWKRMADHFEEEIDKVLKTEWAGKELLFDLDEHHAYCTEGMLEKTNKELVRRYDGAGFRINLEHKPIVGGYRVSVRVKKQEEVE